MRILFLILALTVSATAATWYAGPSSAGANNGTSRANQWALSAVTWGSGGVVAGDTLSLDEGTYTGEYTVGASGTEGSPITIQPGTDHSGLVLFDKQSEGDAGSGVQMLCSRDWVTFDGLGGRMAFVNFWNTNDNVATAGINGTTGSDNITIVGVNFTNMNNAIWFNVSTGTKVAWCNIVGVRGDGAIKLVGSTGTFDASQIFSNYIQTLYSTNKPAASAFAYGGPDGVQTGSGVSIFANTFRVDTNYAIYTSSQHPDTIQCAGDNVRVYGNTFINCGDSSFDFDGFSNLTPSDIEIYNNVFRIEYEIDTFPEAIRFYTSSGSLSSFTNIRIMNNTFDWANSSWSPVRIILSSGSPTASGCIIQNNIFYRAGNGASFPVIGISESSGWVAADWGIQTNVFYRATGTQYVNIDGTGSTVGDWVASNGGSTSLPGFVDAAAGDYRLTAEDTVARGQGVNLSAYFTTDKNNVARGSTFDIGAYEHEAEGAPPAGGSVRAQTVRGGKVRVR